MLCCCCVSFSSVGYGVLLVVCSRVLLTLLFFVFHVRVFLVLIVCACVFVDVVVRRALFLCIHCCCVLVV